MEADINGGEMDTNFGFSLGLGAQGLDQGLGFSQDVGFRLGLRIQFGCRVQIRVQDLVRMQGLDQGLGFSQDVGFRLGFRVQLGCRVQIRAQGLVTLADRPRPTKRGEMDTNFMHIKEIYINGGVH